MKAMKIVVTNNQDFSDAQIARLNSLGDVTYYEGTPQSAEEYLKRVKGADIICSGTAGLTDAYKQLKDVYVTISFVSSAFIKEPEIMRKNNVTLSNAPGANKYAVSEWITAMLLLLSRNLLDSINREETYRVDGRIPPITPGLTGKNITILGKGHIGKRAGEIAEVLGMKTAFFTRKDDLHESVANADYVVDTLSSNPSTHNLLSESFFAAMKKGSYFISITRQEIVDEDALLEAIDSGHLAGATMDCGGILVGDTEDELYQKYLRHPKIITTPHTAYNGINSMERGQDTMIDNVEAYINGKPQNIVI